jgi:hypothetical protein
MLDKIKSLFKDGVEYTHTAGLLQQIANIVSIVHVQYMKDADGKNAAIDHICDLLQSHKDVVAPVVVEAVPAPISVPVEASNVPS